MKSLVGAYWDALSPALQKYYRASVWPGLLFLLLAFLHEWVARHTGVAAPLRLAASIAPVAGMAWLFGVYLRFLRDCDELERRIELSALAWAAGIAMHGTMAVLFLLDAGLLQLPAQRVAVGILVLLLGSYAVIRMSLHHRYA